MSIVEQGVSNVEVKPEPVNPEPVNPQAVSRGCWDCEARRVRDARVKRIENCRSKIKGE